MVVYKCSYLKTTKNELIIKDLNNLHKIIESNLITVSLSEKNNDLTRTCPIFLKRQCSQVSTLAPCSCVTSSSRYPCTRNVTMRSYQQHKSSNCSVTDIEEENVKSYYLWVVFHFFIYVTIYMSTSYHYYELKSTTPMHITYSRVRLIYWTE